MHKAKRKKTQRDKDWFNQKYAIAVDSLPNGCYTIEKYVKEILKAELTPLQRTCLGQVINSMANKDKIPCRYVKHPVFVAVRYYEKIFLDMAIMEYFRQQNQKEG